MQKSFKKTIALILSIMMIVSVIPMGLSFAAESDYTYTIADDKATITKYTGSDEEVVVPDTLGGYPVVAIAEKAFRDNLAIKKIKFADSIESVGNLAFYKCQSLVEVNLGNGVKTLNGAVFSNCQTIDTVIIGKSLTNVGTGAFNGTTVNKVLYKGSEAEWAAITIGDSNNRFTSAEIEFNYCEHEIVEVAEKAAECEKDGNIQYWTCTLCNKNYSDANATTEITEIDSIVIPAKGHTYTSEVTAPTCTEDGYTTHTCATCGDIYTDSIVNAKGHKKVVGVEGIDATCTKDGKTPGYKCETCGNNMTPSRPIKALGHNYVLNAEKSISPTCTKEGENYYECSRCTNIKSEKVAIVPHTVVIDAAVAATCTEAGKTEGSHCSVCNVVFEAQEVINKLGHDEEIIPAVDPTCTETGLTKGKKCTRCGVTTLEQNVVDALKHAEETIPAADPTCTETGLTEGKKCTRCGVTTLEQNVVDKLGHAEETIPAVDPTCTATGLTEGKKCSVCNVIIVSQKEVPMVEHTYGEAVITNAPTCTAKGESKKTCTVCNYELVEEVDMIAHTKVVIPGKDATCTEAGYTSVEYCSVCNNYLAEKEEIPALEHKFVKVEDKSYAPTCTEDGRIYKQCSRSGCSEVDVEVLTKLGHDLNTFEGKATTCTEAGYKPYEKCKRCDHNTYEVIPALNHTAGAAATCTTAQTCTVCGKELVAAKGHTEVVMKAEAPGCETTGKTEGKVCSTCNTVLVEQTVVDATGHDYVKNEVESKLPTCTEFGRNVSVCTKCNNEKIDSINPLGHDTEAFEGKAATCTEAGYEPYVKCKKCDYNTYKVIDKLGHTAGADATCTTAQTCTVCDKVLIKAYGHDIEVYAAADATCTVNGITEGEYCKRCKTMLKEQVVIPAPGHTNEKLAAIDPTCTKNGLKEGWKCSVCNEILVAQAVIPMTGHKRVVIKAVDATCTTVGYTEGEKCENCGEIYVEPIKVNALGHIMITVPGKSATCTEKGLSDGKKCNRLECDYVEVEQQEIPVKAHREKFIPKVEPTCTASGWSEGTECADCGTVIRKPTEIAATGHKEGADATCTKPQTCTKCNEVLLPAFGHTPGAAATCTAAQTCKVCKAVIAAKLPHAIEYDNTVTKPATCYSDGYEKGKCKNCDYSFENSIPMTGHNVQNWTTTVEPKCNAEGMKVGLCLNCKYTIEESLPIVDHKDADNNKKCDFCGKSMGGITLPDFGGNDDTDDGSCSCNCHAIGIKGLIFDFILFLQRLFGLNKTCKCGEAHY